MYRYIPEIVVPDKPLGRHVNHDPRSRAYPHVPRAARMLALSSKRWPRKIPTLDQASLGSCTGNAETGALGTEPDVLVLTPTQVAALDETFAVKLYSLATSLDPFSGAYPPDDTGSDGVSVCKAAQQLGYISGYTHAFSLDAMKDALQTGPVIIGINWYSGSDDPSGDGYCHVTGTIRGGHEVVVDEIDVEHTAFGFTNSWGGDWGQSGRARFTWDDMDRLLHEDGDVTVNVPFTAPAPTPVYDIDADTMFAAQLHKMLAKRVGGWGIRTAARAWLKKRGL